jgi:transposase-like protein
VSRTPSSTQPPRPEPRRSCQLEITWERLNKEIRRRTDVVGIFPDRGAIIRLVGAVLMEQTDEWTEARRYMGLEFLAKARLRIIAGDPPNENTTTQAITA